jgi:Bacteriophage abortive infection AbiH
MAVINIIGNGFDRAHGLKTAYGDFIKHIINESINSNEDVRSQMLDVGKLLNEEQSYDNIKEKFRNLVNTRQIVFHNDFLRMLIEKYFNADWIEIEEYYFEILKNCKSDNLEYLKKLHNEFIQVRSFLEKYLADIVNEDVFLEEYLDFFVDSKHVDNLFLNFNYTNTLDKYFSNLKSVAPSFKFDLIHLHGRLFDQDNPIVFGYGDENEDYFRVRDFDNEFTKFHKTHIYPKKSNKTNLLEFLRTKKNIHVNVFGHSCGISDRVLLKQIFEHTDVRRIKIYFHQNESEDNFQDISSNIFKTVSNNNLMDVKLVTMPDCKPMPQFIKVR